MCRRFAVLTHHIGRFIDLNLRGVFLFRVCAIWGFEEECGGSVLDQRTGQWQTSSLLESVHIRRI